MPDLSLPKSLRYHLWANDRTLNVLRRMQEPPRKAVDLFAHIVAADHAWLHRAGLLDDPPATLGPEGATVVDCTRRWDEIRERWTVLLDQFDTLDLGRTVDYTNSRGEAYSNTLADIFAHVVNHGTHHRAQIQALVREAGGKPPVLDMIAFIREPDRR